MSADDIAIILSVSLPHLIAGSLVLYFLVIRRFTKIAEAKRVGRAGLGVVIDRELGKDSYGETTYSAIYLCALDNGQVFRWKEPSSSTKVIRLGDVREIYKWSEKDPSQIGMMGIVRGRWLKPGEYEHTSNWRALQYGAQHIGQTR